MGNGSSWWGREPWILERKHNPIKAEGKGEHDIKTNEDEA